MYRLLIASLRDALIVQIQVAVRSRARSTHCMHFMHLYASLHAPSICTKSGKRYISKHCGRPNHLTKCVWNFNCHCVQRPAHPTLSTVADATMAQSVICHCYPEWHNFPVYVKSEKASKIIKWFQSWLIFAIW